jgi:pilus assembly protein CpaE
MDFRDNNRVTGLNAILVAPDRELAAQFTASVAQTHSFQILADLKSYPPQQTIEIRMRQLKPHVVLIDVASDLEAGCELIEQVAKLNGESHIVALHREGNSDAILRALRCGASEFLHAPFDASSQSEAVARLLKLRQPEAPTETELGNIAVFSSVKPGSGASTLATQTAFALKRLTGGRILLADLDLTGGTIGFYLKLNHAYSLVEALQHADHLDPALWNSLTVNCGGVDILAAPAAPFAEPIEASRLHIVLDYARTMYDWVIIDLPVIFQRISLMTITQAERAFLVSTSELPSLHLARKAVTMLGQLGFPKERFQIVVNRVNRKDGISAGDMEKLFNCAVHASFPNDYFSLHRVVTLGQPLAGDGELGKAIEALAGRLSGSTANGKKANAPLADVKLAFSVL